MNRRIAEIGCTLRQAQGWIRLQAPLMFPYRRSRGRIQWSTAGCVWVADFAGLVQNLPV